MKVLVCAAGKYGATSEIAQVIADVLAERGCEVTALSPEKATKARDHQVFTGKLVKKSLSFPDRAVASAIRAEDGDLRNWAQIKDWAAGVADTLQS